jgi:hypothetical protein
MIRTLFCRILALFLLPALILWTGCKDDEVNPSTDGSYMAYFPLIPGSWIIYDADSVVHLDGDDINGVDTMIERYKFQIREQVDSSYIDAESDTAFRISRFRRDNDSLPWNFQNLWIAKRTNYSGQRVEDNIRFVKLSFPVDPRITWNGNAFNYFPEELYYYSSVHVPYTLQSLTFDSTVTVVQNDFVTNISRINKKEIYAFDVGLIERQFDSLRVRNTGGAVLILNGTEYVQKINSYGR